jgi:ferredoxin-NADP reductase
VTTADGMNGTFSARDAVNVPFTAPMRRPSAFMRRLDRVAGAAAQQAVRRARRRPPPAAVERDLPVVVDEVVAESPDAVGLRLVARAGGTLPEWRPGAHIDVVLPSGRLRQYSLCGDPADRRAYRITVRRIDGGAGGSTEMHALAPGDTLVVRGPRNAFPFVAAPSYLFLAGGIGITPLAPMVRAAAASGARWRLLHTGRDLASLPLSGALAARFPGQVVRRSDTGHGGVPTAAELLTGLAPGDTVYCCGPPPMIDAVRAAVPADTPFHAERFSAPPVRGGSPFTIRLGDGGPAVAVAADRTALDAVRAIRPDVAYSCRQGFCGTCHVRVLRGATVQDPAGPGRMALCVGRAAGTEVVVDVRP